ncbi:MAG: Lrp/AsnC family transcriptional regulator [Candidatus Thorarchaeota archaeon]
MDQLDRDLLRILQKDAKTPFTKIAKELEQPDTTIHFRAKRLKDTNTVTRFCALVRPEALGYSTAAILRIEIGGHIVPDISKGRARTFADELAKEEHYLWVAVEDEPMVVHALMMGIDEEDIRKKTETLRKSPDIMNVTLTPVNSIAKGWEISGIPE